MATTVSSTASANSQVSRRPERWAWFSPAEAAGESALGDHQLLHRRGIGGIGGGARLHRYRAVARGDHRLEGLALVLDVALGDLDQVGDEIVAPLELDVDLREGVLEAVA